MRHGNLSGSAAVPDQSASASARVGHACDGVPDVGQLVLAGLGPEDGEDAVVVDLEDVRRQRLAGPGARRSAPGRPRPGSPAAVSRAGSRLMPLTNDDRSRSGSPVTSRSGSRSNSAWKVTAISRRARCAPEAEVRAVAAEADVRVGIAGRGRTVRVGEDGGVAVGRGVEEQELVARRGSGCPSSSPSWVAVRRIQVTGLAQRTISSTAVRVERRVGHPAGPLLGVLGQREDAVGDRVARRLVAGDQQQDEERRDLLVRSAARRRPRS